MGVAEREGKEEAQKNVSFMEHCGPERLHAKKRHVVAGRPVFLCVSERETPNNKRRRQSATVHTTLWVGQE